MCRADAHSIHSADYKYAFLHGENMYDTDEYPTLYRQKYFLKESETEKKREMICLKIKLAQENEIDFWKL